MVSWRLSARFGALEGRGGGAPWAARRLPAARCPGRPPGYGHIRPVETAPAARTKLRPKNRTGQVVLFVLFGYLAAVTPRMPSREALLARVRYDRETGALFWRVRPAEMFRTPGEAARWNKLFAGKPAFAKPDSEGYLRGEINVDGERYRLRAHRVIHFLETGENPSQVDHKDGAITANAPANLRSADKFTNRWNSAGKRGRELPKCVEPSGRRFRALTVVAGVKYNFGSYDTPEEASAAYRAGVRGLHGEFFR